MRAGEPAALEAFFEHYFDWLYGLVHWLLGDRTLAEDVTQDIVVKLHRNLPRIDPSRDPAPWLYVIAYNACRDLWRSASFRARRGAVGIGAGDGAIDLESPGPDPGAALDAARRERLVREAVHALPETLRTVVVLYQYEGLDHRAIAEITGANHAAVRKRYSRALRWLAERLKGSVVA